MKKIFLFTICALVSTVLFAQKYVPQIKAGTTMDYTAIAKATGQSIPLNLKVNDITIPLRLQWSIPGLGSGTFEMSAKALETGKKMTVREPTADDVTKLRDDETLLILSKNSFNSLLTTKSFDLNGQTFILATDTKPYTINDKEADVLYAVTANGKSKMWILNNPAFPLICQTQTNMAVDFTLKNIKE